MERKFCQCKLVLDQEVKEDIKKIIAKVNKGEDRKIKIKIRRQQWIRLFKR